MKNTLIVLAFALGLFSQAQDQDQDPVPNRHEIKANVFNLILFKAPEFSYEYILDSESAVGVSILFNLENTEDGEFIDGPYYYERFAFTPYYRRFISRNYARGFFLEAFGMYNVQGDYDGTWSNDNQTVVYTDDTSGNLAFGVALGAKFLSRGGFLFEFYAGTGRNIIIANEALANEFVPRVGINLGFRF